MLEDFRLIDRFRVPYHAIDMMQHVNHAHYIIWAETIRARYIREVLDTEIRGSRGGILAKLVVDYERQMDWDEPVAVGIRVVRFGTKSYDMVHEIWSERTGKRTAVILGTMVAFDYPANKSIVVPAEWRARALAFEALAPEGAHAPGTRDGAVKE